MSFKFLNRFSLLVTFYQINKNSIISWVCKLDALTKAIKEKQSVSFYLMISFIFQNYFFIILLKFCKNTKRNSYLLLLFICLSEIKV